MSVEKTIELAIIAVLENNAEFADYTVRRWRDNSQAAKYPAILVYCSPVDPSEVEPRCQTSYEMTVSIGVETYLDDDKDRAKIDDIIGKVRIQLESSAFLADCEAETPVYLWLDRTFTSGSITSENSNLNKQQITINIYIQKV